MKKFLAPALAFLAIFGLVALDSGSSTAFAQAVQGGLIDGADRPDNLTQATTNYEGSFRRALTTIVNYFLFFLGLIATIMVIYGGFLYIVSAGDDGIKDKGKNILLYAAIGIIIVLISYALVNTLLSAGSETEPLTSFLIDQV